MGFNLASKGLRCAIQLIGLAEFCASYATKLLMTCWLESHINFGLHAMQGKDYSQTRIEFVWQLLLQILSSIFA